MTDADEPIFEPLPLKILYTLSFNELFNEPPQSVESFLVNIDPKGIFLILLDMLYLPDSPGSGIESYFVFDVFLERIDPIVKSQLMKRMKQFEGENRSTSILSRFNTIKFIEYIIKNHKRVNYLPVLTLVIVTQIRRL